MKHTIEPEIRRLERHLYKCIWAEAMASNEVLSVSLELQCLTVVLANEIAQTRLREVNADPDRRSQRPYELDWSHGIFTK